MDNIRQEMHIERIAEQMGTLVPVLERIAVALEKLARGNEPEELNYVKPIDDYRAFAWEGIGASIVQQDADGPTHVEQGGFLWTRRSPQNKFEPAIWFSRPNGKDDDGNVRYLRLITFRTIKDADPLPRKAAEAAHNGSNGTNGSQAAQAHAESRTNGAPAHVSGTNEYRAEAQRVAAAQRPSGTNGQPKGAAMMPVHEYMALATGKKFNLSAQAAQQVAVVAGVVVDDLQADYSPAVKFASYFAECKALGVVKFLDAKEILQRHGGDLQAAIFDVRDNHNKGA